GGQCPPRQGHAPLHQRPHFLGLGQRGDDASLDLGRVLVIGRVPLREDQGACQVAQQGALMVGIPAELAAAFSMSHGTSVCFLNWDARGQRGNYTPAEVGSRIPSRKPNSVSFCLTSLSVVSPK